MMVEFGLSTETLDELLLETSRTFALAIPLLPEPTRRQVSVAYLLFRVADTLEDAEKWPLSSRIRALDAFAGLLRKELDPSLTTAAWFTLPPSDHAGYLRLLKLTPELLAALDSLGDASELVRKYTLRTTLGMRDVLAEAGEEESSSARKTLQLTSIEELRQYCYYVAGIVGELLTELFVHAAPELEAVRSRLVADERLFGEGLQLVNILKDQADDAEAERIFIPADVSRETLFALAREDLHAAARYVATLEEARAPAGFRAFTGLPMELARAALDELERRGPGAKVGRAETLQMFERYRALANSESAQSGK